MMEPRTIRHKHYSRDYMPCDCATAIHASVACGPVDCTYVDGRTPSSSHRGRVWCVCVTCGTAWRESSEPIRGPGDRIVIDVDRSPYPELSR
jgi:hypothetical protein